MSFPHLLPKDTQIKHSWRIFGRHFAELLATLTLLCILIPLFAFLFSLFLPLVKQEPDTSRAGNLGERSRLLQSTLLPNA